jgi:hypothetical protein
MRVRRRRSRKQSAASSGSQRERPPVYFVDECLGRHIVAEALRKAGAHVEVYYQHFPLGAPDAEWLPVVGRRGWIVLTKDRHIRRRELEISALVHARVRAFVLTAADLTGAEQAVVFVSALGKMNRIGASSRGPLVGRSARAALCPCCHYDDRHADDDLRRLSMSTLCSLELTETASSDAARRSLYRLAATNPGT